MEKQTIYIYPAIFSYESSGISVRFPDFPEAISCGDDDYEAVKNAKDILASIIALKEDEGFIIPGPSQFVDIDINANEKIFPIEVWMPYYRGLIKEVYIKKTLTIPSWLNTIAEHNNINFSQTLQEALKHKLNIKKTSDFIPILKV